MEKIYAYADETGQDTRGKFFLVSVAIVPAADVPQIETCETSCEEKSGRNRRKWSDSEKKQQVAYLGALVKQDLRGLRVFIHSYSGRSDYPAMTAEAVARSIRAAVADSTDYKATILIDGMMSRAETERMKRALKPFSIRYRNVRGVRDENSPEIRLADSLAGMARDAASGDLIAQHYEDSLAAKGVLVRQ